MSDSIVKKIPAPQHFGEVITPDQPEEQMNEEFMAMYNDFALDPNNMSFWLPKIMPAAHEALKIPKTAIVTVPPEVMELFFMEKQGMTTTEIAERIYNWVRDEFYPTAKTVVGDGLWFLKNGSFSNKFVFKNCRTLSSDLMKMTANIIDINYTSLCFDAGGTTEMIAREFIAPPKDIPTIYEGMPLRCEIRIFYDFDNHKPLYHVNYWDWDYCNKDICRDPTDAIVYKHECARLQTRYQQIAPVVTDIVAERMAKVDSLSGVWSIDVMENNEYSLYLIDMAVGYRSAYWNPVKAGVSNGTKV